MCACSHNFTCHRCKGTPFDPAYMDSDPEPSFAPPQMFGLDAE